jgi:exonuclease V gamma subunit
MDEGAFPRQGARDELDLMRRAPRFGDRLARIDDRGTFLDAVLAARDRLLVLCRSRHARDDTPLNPSPLVGELLAYLSAQLDPAAGASFEASRRPHPQRAGPPALIEHPLHPFSARNFVAAGSYAQEWLATARELARPLPQRAQGIGALVDPVDALGQGQGASETPGVATMPVEALRDALADPVGIWLRDSLGLRLLRERAPPDDAEPLWTDDDDRNLVQACVDRLLAGEEDGRVVRELEIAPQTAAGAPGHLHAESAVRRARALVAEAMSGVGSSAARTASLPTVAELDGLRVSALVPVLGGNAPVFVTAFPLSPHALIDAWLRAAIWRAVRGDGPSARLVSPDHLVELRCPDPQRSLRHALSWAARIGREPLALFPRSWLRYALALARPPRAGAPQSPEARQAAARERARDALVGGEFGGRTPELARPAAQALFRDAEPDIEAVLALGERVYRPMLDDAVVQPRHEDSA